MNVLYATYRYDPSNPDLGSSLDYECYNAILRAGYRTDIVGPVTSKSDLAEKIEYRFWQAYKKCTGKHPLKFPLMSSMRASRMLRLAAQEGNPDVVFSVFPPFFVSYNGPVPYVWYFDTTFWGQEQEWPLYGRLPLKISIWQEKKVLDKAARIVTMSKWCKDILVYHYGISEDRIEIVPLFATLPERVIPADIDVLVEKRLEKPLRILLVGREYERKGIDIALEIVQQLNKDTVPSKLVVCGLAKKPYNLPPNVDFVGSYRKSDPQQLHQYVDWYKWANILLHPARFEAGGTVLSEAAAFATPSITNDTGGLATTVSHGESGIVLPRGSAADAYVQAIKTLVGHPHQYYDLCRKTKLRYARELSSSAAGRQIVRILNDVVAKKRLSAESGGS